MPVSLENEGLRFIPKRFLKIAFDRNAKAARILKAAESERRAALMDADERGEIQGIQNSGFQLKTEVF